MAPDEKLISHLEAMELVEPGKARLSPHMAEAPRTIVVSAVLAATNWHTAGTLWPSTTN